jgi:hypothetical protein
MRPGTPGVEIHPTLAPVNSEPVIDKTEPNGFLGTDLAEVLEELDVHHLHVVGMMSSMCVEVTVVHDGCAAPTWSSTASHRARWSTPRSWPPWPTATPTW